MSGSMAIMWLADETKGTVSEIAHQKLSKYMSNCKYARGRQSF
jgi:hypothetical protein